jgi:hypothetical protein
VIEAVNRIPAVPTILDVVCRTTGMGFAAMARVTEDRWIACTAQDRDDLQRGPGASAPLPSRRQLPMSLNGSKWKCRTRSMATASLSCS